MRAGPAWDPRGGSPTHSSGWVLVHRDYSAFAQTDLDATCRVRRIDRLVVTRQHTDCCCLHTSYDAFARGITVVAVSDATAVYEPLTFCSRAASMPGPEPEADSHGGRVDKGRLAELQARSLISFRCPGSRICRAGGRNWPRPAA